MSANIHTERYRQTDEYTYTDRHMHRPTNRQIRIDKQTRADGHNQTRRQEGTHQQTDITPTQTHTYTHAHARARAHAHTDRYRHNCGRTDMLCTHRGIHTQTPFPLSHSCFLCWPRCNLSRRGEYCSASRASRTPRASRPRTTSHQADLCTCTTHFGSHTCAF